MIKSIERIVRTFVLVFAGSMALWSCESEADNLGSQFFDGAAGTVKSYDVVTYNVDNQDRVQSDASRLSNALLGAFSEKQFGTQKASYFTQVRLSSYAPDFGTNPVVDSVVLVMKPVYASDSVTTKTYDNYTYPDGNIPSKKVVSSYPVSKYGKAHAAMTINVNEVADFMGAQSDTLYSNKDFAAGVQIGSMAFNGNITSVKVTKTADNTDILSRDAGLRIPLDKAFFQNKIIPKGSATELSDASNFIRYFRGLKISVAENDGYLLRFTPNDLQMVMYYKRDITTNGVTTPTQTTYSFDLGGANTHFSQFRYDRTGTGVASAGYNSTTGDGKLYLQGTGGPGMGIRVPAATVEELRSLYKNKGIGILSAKIKLYSDISSWNNTYAKPTSFVAKQKDSKLFLSDMSTLSGNAVFSLVKAYDLALNPSSYEITITQTIKDIVEKQADNKDLIINVGTYEVSSQNGAYIGQDYNSRAYWPNRLVLVGSADTGNAKRPQLNIIYTNK